MKFEILDKQVVYKGFFQLEVYQLRHELYAGGWTGKVRREHLERGKAVAVLLHDPATDMLLLVEQFRIGAIRDEQGPWMLEIVAGMVEEGEENADVARREAEEEAGCQVTEVEFIMDYYPSAGSCSETISIYYAPVDLSGIEPGIHGLAEENEDIRTLLTPTKTAIEWLQAGKIRSSMTIIALQWLALKQLNNR
uniref:ADP-ribose pyrophosphatase n=1 Tax=uncultured Thiotrichaceae bacterium TaxID=298394 RepID=A0A6S6UNW2_9GAMM|nr:MAG: ADP-ribose pyrophosphatase (EC [uncultured Thiotrichaceae bacterium]